MPASRGATPTLPAPTGLTATGGDAQVTLSWTAPVIKSTPVVGTPTVDGYDIYQGTSAGGESASPVNATPVPGTSYTVTGLSDGTTYYFVVRAVWLSASGASLGPGLSSGEASATTLGAPTGLTATGGDAQVTLSWTAPAPNGATIDGYDIYQGTSAGGESPSPVNATPVPGTSYTVTGLNDGTTYYFTVAAVYSTGQQGPSSGEAYATPVAARLGAPTGLTATPRDSQVTLAWSPPPGGGPRVTGYDIYQGTSPGGESASPVNATPVPGTSYTVTGLNDGTTYYFTVAAVYSTGQRGPSSGEASATPRRPPPPPPPSLPAGWHIRHSLAPPSRSVFAWPKVLESLGLAALLILLVGFPAELFNSTYEENEETIRHALSRMTRRKERKDRPAGGLWAGFIFFAVSAAFTTLVDPTFDFGWTGATVFAGFAVAIPLTMAAYAYPTEWYQRRASKITGRFHVIALALLIAAFLTAMSRLVHFNPGYVYGLIAGFTAKRKLSTSQEAKSVLAGAACVFGLGAAAWIVWGKYDAVAQGSHASHAEAIIGAVIAQLAIMGISSVVFGLMPFKFMDGYQLRTWSRTGWACVYAVAAFCFALVLIRSNPDVLQQPSVPAAIAEPFILFAVFGVLSVLFWLYFRLHPSPENAAGHEPAGPATPPKEAGGNVARPRLPADGDAAEAKAKTRLSP